MAIHWHILKWSPRGNTVERGMYYGIPFFKNGCHTEEFWYKWQVRLPVHQNGVHCISLSEISPCNILLHCLLHCIVLGISKRQKSCKQEQWWVMTRILGEVGTARVTIIEGFIMHTVAKQTNPNWSNLSKAQKTIRAEVHGGGVGKRSKCDRVCIYKGHWGRKLQQAVWKTKTTFYGIMDAFRFSLSSSKIVNCNSNVPSGSPCRLDGSVK